MCLHITRTQAQIWHTYLNTHAMVQCLYTHTTSSPKVEDQHKITNNQLSSWVSQPVRIILRLLGKGVPGPGCFCCGSFFGDQRRTIYGPGKLHYQAAKGNKRRPSWRSVSYIHRWPSAKLAHDWWKTRRFTAEQWQYARNHHPHVLLSLGLELCRHHPHILLKLKQVTPSELKNKAFWGTGSVASLAKR